MSVEMTVRPYVNHGRWLAPCPTRPPLEGRPVDHLIVPGQRAVHCPRFCGGMVRIVWPADIKAIEQVLAARPVENRNWTPDETLDDLREQNVEHGLRAD